MMSTIVSVRADDELKEEAEKLGINVRELMEKALKEEIDRRRRKEFEKIVDVLLKGMDAVSEEEFAKVIKEWRRKR